MGELEFECPGLRYVVVCWGHVKVSRVERS